MSPLVSRRTFLATAASVSLVGVSGCNEPRYSAQFSGTAEDGPILAFDDAIAVPGSDESFIHHLSGEKLRHFDALFFVNKSAYGVYAQTLKILKPDSPGEENTVWRVRETIDVSTGREMEERYFTTTPRGIFTLDPYRRYEEYQSVQWDGADMPFAMFWDYIYPDGRPTGIAFHAATGVNEHYIGIRASGGCIRTKMDDAKRLFEMVDGYRGKIPDFQDRDPRGLLQYDDDGAVVTKNAFKILVAVEDNENIVWNPFVREEIWERRLGNKRILRDNPSFFELVDAGQN